MTQYNILNLISTFHVSVIKDIVEDDSSLCNDCTYNNSLH